MLAVLRTLTLGAWFTVFAIYPTGRFLPRWVAVAPAIAVAWTIVLSIPPVHAAEAANDPLWWALEAAVYAVCVATIVAAQFVQFRRGDRDDRRRIRLLLGAFVRSFCSGSSPSWGMRSWTRKRSAMARSGAPCSTRSVPF